MDINLALHLQINISTLLLSIILLIHNYNRKTEIIGKSFFGVATAMIMTISLVNGLAWYVEGKIFPGSYWIYYICVAFELLCMVISCSCIMLYSLAQDINVKNIKVLIFVFIPTLIEFVMLIINIFHPFMFYIDATNVYHRLNPWYFYSAVIPWSYVVFGIIFCFVKYIQSRFKNITYLHLIIFQVSGIIGSIIQLLFYQIESLWTLILFGLVYAYITVQSKRYEDVQKDATDAKISVMLSQIKPHFLYNLFTTIMVLCDDDPKVAKKALGEFALYLRGNMDSLSSDKPISFKNELDHVKKYMYLETLRFGERLKSEFNINEEEFELPALSLQPIVENAVKYGIGGKTEGGVIKITSYKDDNYYYILVEDNGVGMNIDRIEDIPKKDDGRSHVGLQNVRRRIREMSNGDVLISSKLGEGTSVTIKIPVIKGEN